MGEPEPGQGSAAFSLAGVFAAVLTRLDGDLAPDIEALVRHCRWLLATGCDGLSVLGTTGEANSFTVEERLRILEGIVDAGIPPARLIPGTGCCAIPDTVRLTRLAVGVGAAGVLVLPPFYYKNVSDEGTYAAFAQVIEQIGDDRLRLYLYHFPKMSGVPIRPTVIERLLKAYPNVVAGMKDSSGDLAGMVETARRFPGFAVFSGSDELLLPILKAGGAGCITAVCNIAHPFARQVVDAMRQGRGERAEQVQAKLEAVRRTVAVYPLVAALKEIMARHSGDNQWRRLRAPLTPLSADDASALLAALHQFGFAPPPL